MHSWPHPLSALTPDSPLILSPPVDTEAGAGQLVTFSCLAIGPPEPTISWRRLDSALQSDSVQLEGTLYLFSVTADDNGRYECNATNIYGWRVAAANLTVLPGEASSRSAKSQTQPSIVGIKAFTRVGVALYRNT